MPNGDRPGSIYEQEPPSLLEALGEILEPTYELPGLSSYTRAVGKASDILDAPITKRKEEFAKAQGMDVEDVSRADIGAGIPLSLMLGGTLGGHSNPLAAAARAMGDPRVTPGDLPAILAPASGDPETGLYSQLDVGFAIADVVTLGLTKPVRRIAGKVLDDFSDVVKSAREMRKVKRMEKDIARLQAESPGVISGGPEPIPVSTLSPEAQQVFADLAETSQASLVPDIADVPPTAAIPDAPSPKVLPEGKVLKTTDDGVEYISSGIDEFDALEKRVMAEAVEKEVTIKGFNIVEDTKNFKIADMPDEEVAIIRVRKTEGRKPLPMRDRDVVIHKSKTSDYGSGTKHVRYTMGNYAPERELLEEGGGGISRLSWGVQTNANGKNTISGISFFGKLKQQKGIVRPDEVEEITSRLLASHGDSYATRNKIKDAIEKVADDRITAFGGMASHDFITFLPDNWQIIEDSLTMDSFMLLLRTAVDRKAMIIFDPGNLQQVSGGHRSEWYRKAGSALVDANGNFRRGGVEDVIKDAVRVLKRHKHPERIISDKPIEDIFSVMADDAAIGRYRRARLDPRLRRKLQEQHGVERTNEIMEQIEKGFPQGPHGWLGEDPFRGSKGIEFGQMTIKQVKTVMGGLMFGGGAKEFDEFMNFNPESMESRIFDNEQMF